MLHWLEIAFLHFVAWFYTIPAPYGLIVLGAPGLALFIFQFYKKGKTIWPGIIGLALLYAEWYHLLPNKRIEVITRAHQLIQSFETPRANLQPLRWFEPIFNFIVGDVKFRMIGEEVFCLTLFTYLGFVLYGIYDEYKKTGVMLGGLSISAVMPRKQKRPQRSLTNELGSGDLATAEQIARWTKPAKLLDTVLNVTDLRGSEGTSFKHAKLVIPAAERNRHILCIAKTGSGKTTRMILPVLYSDCMDPERSTIVIDSKPEMWRKLAHMTRKYNPHKNILLFNPLDTARSLSWNILGKIEDETDCKLIANTVIMATDQPGAKSDSPFFRNNALAILNAIMVGLLHDPTDTLSMPRIHELVQSGMKPLCDWLEQHPHALRNTRTFVELARSGSQNADTIMSELSMRLSAWDLPDVRATTHTNELDIEELITKPTLFVVELRESEIEMLRPMANVIVIELLRFLTKRAERMPAVSLPRPVGLVIDEFSSSLGRLPDIHVKLNTLRSRNVSITASIQSIAQVKANYGDDADSVLAGFTTKIFMPTLDIQDAEWASKETGQMTIRFKTASIGSNKKLIEWFASRNDSTQEQVQQRAVLTPDEIGRPVDNISTLFMPNTPVFQGNLVPYFNIPEMNRRISEFDKDEFDFQLRTSPIVFQDTLPQAGPAAGSAPAGGYAAPNIPVQPGIYAPFAVPPPGVSNSGGWTEEQVVKKLDEVKAGLDWENTTGSARKWWEAFESENKHRMALVLRLAEELALRKATITEFFLAYVYSNTDNIQANLCYLDYTRLKKEEEKRKRETAAGAEGSPPPYTPPEETAPPSSGGMAVGI